MAVSERTESELKVFEALRDMQGGRHSLQGILQIKSYPAKF